MSVRPSVIQGGFVDWMHDIMEGKRPLPTSDPSRHHYVAQFQLAKFKGKGRLWQLDKEDGTCRVVTPKVGDENVARGWPRYIKDPEGSGRMLSYEVLDSEEAARRSVAPRPMPRSKGSRPATCACAGERCRFDGYLPGAP